MKSITEHLAEFWRHVDAGELRVQWCSNCERYQHHPRPVCRTCLGDDLTFRPIGSSARLYSWSTARAEFGDELRGAAPYDFGLVEFDDQPGLRMVVSIDAADRSRLRVGAPMRVALGPVVGRDRGVVATEACG